ncbi:MAG: BolA family protein [Microcoleaceae cyanobacterium]
MISLEQVTTMIKAELPDAQVKVEDLGGGDHLQATVVSEQFVGKTLVKQHQMVYKAVNSILVSQDIHALTLKTYTPEQWASATVNS